MKHATILRRTAFALSALLTAALPAPSTAQERMGIAFVQAPEQSTGLCVAATAEQAFACATKKCTDGGALAADCLRTNWCFPAGWSVDVFLQHNEGVHWHEVSCGWATKSAALTAAKVICDPQERQYVVDCTVTGLYDPQGQLADLN
ncbi:MAG: hypothetical protein AAF035_12315 [Pseudomonadota bacterium]